MSIMPLCYVFNYNFTIVFLLASTLQVEMKVVTVEKELRPSTQTCDLPSNAEFQPHEPLTTVTILHFDLSSFSPGATFL